MLVKLSENENALSAGGNAGFIYLPVILLFHTAKVELCHLSLCQERICNSAAMSAGSCPFSLLLPSGFTSASKPWLCSPQSITKHGRGTWPFLSNAGLLEQAIFAVQLPFSLCETWSNLHHDQSFPVLLPLSFIFQRRFSSTCYLPSTFTDLSVENFQPFPIHFAGISETSN